MCMVTSFRIQNNILIYFVPLGTEIVFCYFLFLLGTHLNQNYDFNIWYFFLILNSN